MKKRLFEGFLPPQSLSVIAITGLICTITVLIRLVSAGGSYAVIPMQIPVLSAPIHDLSSSGFQESTQQALEKTSLAVAMTPREFIFGDLSSFTSSKDDIRGKFLVPHIDGSPQVSTLISQIKSWQDDRAKRLSIRSDRLLVLVPDSRVPMNIVIQVSNLIRDSKMFENVILAGGLQ